MKLTFSWVNNSCTLSICCEQIILQKASSRNFYSLVFTSVKLVFWGLGTSHKIKTVCPYLRAGAPHLQPFTDESATLSSEKGYVGASLDTHFSHPTPVPTSRDWNGLRHAGQALYHKAIVLDWIWTSKGGRLHWVLWSAGSLHLWCHEGNRDRHWRNSTLTTP